VALLHFHGVEQLHKILRIGAIVPAARDDPFEAFGPLFTRGHSGAPEQFFKQPADRLSAEPDPPEMILDSKMEDLHVVRGESRQRKAEGEPLALRRMERIDDVQAE
jgi:hypothetical protein